MTVDFGDSLESSSCGSPDIISGIGLCTLTAASSLFSTIVDVHADVTLTVAYSGSVVATSNAADIVLKKQPAFDSLTAAGMMMTVPHYAHIAGDVISVEISANTDGQALNVWVLEVLSLIHI